MCNEPAVPSAFSLADNVAAAEGTGGNGLQRIMESGGGLPALSVVGNSTGQTLMKKILSNLGLLVLGFGAWVVFDYFYE